MRKSKLTWLLAAFAGLLAGSCSNDEVVTTMGGNDVITFTVNSDNGVQTRAGGELTIPAGKKLRYIMEVYNESGDYVADSRQEKLADEGNHSATFSYLRPQGAVYTAVFWADFTNAAGADAKTDVYYNTTTTDGGTTTGGLTAITVNPSSTTESCGEAFYGSTVINENLSTTATVELTHAVSMVTLKTTAELEKLGSVKVTYGGGSGTAPYSTFNALDGTAGTDAVITKINTVAADKSPSEANPYDFHTFYVFAPADEERLVNMEIAMCSDDAGLTPVQTFSVPSLPLRTNYKTNVTGNFALANDEFAISCSADWGAEMLRPISLWDGNTPGVDADYEFSGGDGSQEKPYLIGSATDLAQLAANLNGGTSYKGKYFSLTTDINLNGTKHNWTVIGGEGGSSACFNGHFDGRHHIIKNFKVAAGDYGHAGLFGRLTDGGTISNLHAIGDVTGTYDRACVGGICGEIGQGCSIANCSFEGTVTGITYYVGGIVGCCSGIITCSKNSGTISGGDTGGIVGCLEGSKAVIAGCYNVGVIKSQNGVGGIWSTGYDGTIMGCYNIGELEGTRGESTIGAIFGKSGFSGKAEACYSKQKYAMTLGDDKEFQFGSGAGAWPDGSSVGGIWYANESNDGTYTLTGSSYSDYALTDCKFWKSNGTWDDTTPEYPKLWWEE